MKKLNLCIPIIFFKAMIMQAGAQLCTNPADTVYGLNSITGSGSGQIVSVNVNNAGANAIGSPAAGSANANGLGFSQITGLFYFFNHIGNSDFTEFVSYNPVSGSKVAKTIPSGPALPLSTSGKIRSGTVTRDGTGYYMVFPGATTAMGYPVTNPAFYYYSISLNTWTRLTQSFQDVLGNNVAEIKTLNSGDMAFDGSDNLWMLVSNSTQYALYKINAPLPTAAVASVTVDTIVPVTSNPISGVSFTGIAFNSTGKMYLSTGSGVGAGNNKLYEMTTPGVLTLKGTLPVNGYGDDLSSCVYPPGVLGISWANFSASLQNNSVKLLWKVNETEDVTGYDIQFSNDAEHWQMIYHLDRNSNSPGLKTYSYVHNGYIQGKSYYRIVQQFQSNKKNISDTRLIDTRNIGKINIGPNPVNDVIYFYNKDDNAALLARVFDNAGQLVYSTIVSPEQQSINVSHLPKGNFILRLSSVNANESPQGHRFFKW